MRACKPLIHRQQGRIECLSQCHVERIPSSYRIPQLPRTLQQPPVPETLARPIAQIRDRLPAAVPSNRPRRYWARTPPSPQRRSHAAPRDRRLRQTRPDRARKGRVRNNLEQARRVNDQHSATHPATRPTSPVPQPWTPPRATTGPRQPLRNRRTRRQPSRLTAQQLSTVIPSSAARRTNAAYMSSSMSRI